jgi:DNA-binding FrmR family transcriptional regulator
MSSSAGGPSESSDRARSAQTAEHLRRLARIEGQVRGIARMVVEDRPCLDVLTQTAAVTRALQAVGLGLLDEHLARCLDDPDRRAGLEAASAAIARLVRS